MSLGIDIHPIYQSSVNWGQVRDRSDVEWVYVKVSDGTGSYTKRKPDAHINGAKGAGFPVGGYHYAQPGNGATQADVLVREHRRFGLTLPPMLDLEAPFTPGPTAIAFAKAFLRRTAELTGHRPCVYMSGSWAKTMRPDQWGIPGLIIWIASYGPNNGQLNKLTGGYPGRVDIHQYTSNGVVNGITARCDINKAYIDIKNTSVPNEEDDMPTAEEVAAKVWSYAQWHPDAPGGIKVGDQVAWTNKYANMIPGVLAAVSAIANDNDITPETLGQMIDDAAAKHTPTAADVAAAQREFLADVIREVVPDALADDVIERMGEKLAATTAVAGSKKEMNE